MSVPRLNSTKTIEMPARRIRAHAKDAGGAVHRGFDRKADERFDLFRRHAVRFRENRYGRRREVRKHIDRRPQRHDAAVDQQPAAATITISRFLIDH